MICKLIQSNKHIPLHPLGGCNKYKKKINTLVMIINTLVMIINILVMIINTLVMIINTAQR